MVGGVFSALEAHQQIEYIIALIQCIHVLPTDDALDAVKVLEKLDIQPRVLIELIEHLSDPLETSVNRKRQRQDAAYVPVALFLRSELTIDAETKTGLHRRSMN